MKPEEKKPSPPSQKDELPDEVLEQAAGGGESGAQGGNPTDDNLRDDGNGK